MIFGIVIGFYIMYLFLIQRKIHNIFERNKYLLRKEIRNNEYFEAFTRNDYKSWNKRSFFLGAALLLPIRFIIIVLSIVLVTISLKVASWIFRVKDYSKSQSKYFNSFCNFILRLYCKIILFNFGFYKISVKKQKPNPENIKYFKKLPDHNPAVIISNHVTMIDIFYYLSHSYPLSFISNISVKDYPCVGIIAQIIQCIFVDRNQSNSRNKCFTDLRERVKNIQKFPESISNL